MTGSIAPRKVLTIDAVRRSIQDLQASTIHEMFVGYLHVRRCGIEQGSLTAIGQRLDDLGSLLRVEGGPKGGFFNPTTALKKNDPSGYWLERIAGSFSNSSLRGSSRFMQSAQAGRFELTTDHVDQAFLHHLKGERRPVWSLAGFLLRDYSFDSSVSDRDVDALIDGFCEVFQFDSRGTGSDFDKLFVTGTEPDIIWFEEAVG